MLHNWTRGGRRSGMQLLTPLWMSFLEALPPLPTDFPWDSWFLWWGCTASLMGSFGKTQAVHEARAGGQYVLKTPSRFMVVLTAGKWGQCFGIWWFARWLVLSNPWFPWPGSILTFFFFLFLFFFLLFRAALAAYGSSQARVELELQPQQHGIRATSATHTTATPDP